MLGNLQQRMADTQAQAAAVEVEGVAGDGMVRVTASGDMKIQAVNISEEAMEDRELLEDLIRAAVNEAIRNANAEAMKGMSALTAGLPIPPGILPGT